MLSKSSSIDEFIYHNRVRILDKEGAIKMGTISKLFGKNASNSDKDVSSEVSNEVVQIEVDKISPNQYQPRSIFDEEKINELAQTIHTHGMIQPIVIRKIEEEERYELIAGERRWRAVQSLEWETIPAIVKNMTGYRNSIRCID